MLSTKRIEKRYGNNICRRCINKVYHVNLQPRDCIYGEMGFIKQCPRCRQDRYIVIGFITSGKLKVLLK